MHMKMIRIGIAALMTLIAEWSARRFAGDLRDSVAAAATAAATADPQAADRDGARQEALMWSGTAMFVGGMSFGLYAFINNKNGRYSEFGEAAATNKKARRRRPQRRVRRRRDDAAGQARLGDALADLRQAGSRVSPRRCPGSPVRYAGWSRDTDWHAVTAWIRIARIRGCGRRWR